jgi:hypothetical protein
MLACRQEQHQKIPALPISLLDHLFRARVRNHDLGCRSRQPPAGVLDTPFLMRTPVSLMEASSSCRAGAEVS